MYFLSTERPFLPGSNLNSESFGYQIYRLVYASDFFGNLPGWKRVIKVHFSKPFFANVIFFRLPSLMPGRILVNIIGANHSAPHLQIQTLFEATSLLLG